MNVLFMCVGKANESTFSAFIALSVQHVQQESFTEMADGQSALSLLAEIRPVL